MSENSEFFIDGGGASNMTMTVIFDKEDDLKLEIFHWNVLRTTKTPCRQETQDIL